MKMQSMLGAAAWMLAAAQGWAAKAQGLDGGALMKKSDCLTCHHPTRKVVGPPFVEIAKKYKGQKGAVEALVKKVKQGGSGNWGTVPMPAHPTLPESDIKAMVEWVLKQKAKK